MTSMHTLKTGAATLLAALPLAAAPIPETGAESRRLLQDNSRRVEDLLQQQRLRQLQMEAPAMTHPEPEGAAAQACLPLRALRVSGITLLTHAELPPLAPPEGDCLDGDTLNRFVRALTAAYVERGYIAARVHAEGPDDAGVLTLRVVEGRVEAVESDNRRLNPATLLPGVVGRPLNVRDLDQGLDQANRLASSHATADVAPGSTPGGSVIRLSTPNAPAWRGAAWLDNSGRPSTGRRNAGGSLSWDSPLGLSDFISVSAQRTTDDNATRHSRSESLFYSLPYGYWTLSAFASRADYLNPQPLQTTTVQLSGSTAQGGARLERVWSRSQDHISAASVQLTHKRVQNYFEDVLLAVSSPTLSVLDLGLSHTQVLSAGVLMGDATLSHGMPWFGADRDHERPVDGLPRPQFTRLKLNLTLQQSLFLPGGPYSLQSTLAAQGSHDRLPAVEQMELADNAAVRGYWRNTLAADTAWFLRNTLSRRFVLEDWALTPRLGLDGGRALIHDGDKTWRGIAGAALGLSLARGPLLLDLEYSRPLAHPDSWAYEGHKLLARLNISF